MTKILNIKLGHVFVVIAMVSLMSCNNQNTDERPNILVVLCDDLGYADLGFNGAKDIQTPAIDNLAGNGIVFSDAYVSHGFCGPSRASLMTGRYPHLIGSQFNLPANSDTLGMGIPLSETFISKVLQDAGYYTGAIGKWHLGSNEEYHPNNRGFDDFYGFLGGGHMYFPEEYQKKYKNLKEKGVENIWDYLHPLEHNGEQVKETEYLTDAFSREAIRFIGESKEKQEPFFLYLAYNAPHSPMQAKAEDLEVYKHIKDEKRRTYAAMVHAVDRGVEEIVQALKENGQYENTLIVVLSDNGGKLVLGADNTPLTAGKGSTYEGGYRVPMMFHWPSNIKTGKQFKYPVSALDFYATFAAMANAEIPEGKELDSKNIMPDVLADKNPHQDEMIYCLRHRTAYSDVGARRNQWKVARVGMKPWQLFNIIEDKGEQNDLSAQHPELVKELVEITEQWSATHLQPYWWHCGEEGVLWKERDMPRFNETFAIE